MGRPIRSACTSALMKFLTSGVETRSPMPATPRPGLADLHLRDDARELAADRPGHGLATCMMAAWKPCPASTQTVSMSSASARPLVSSCCRFAPRL